MTQLVSGGRLLGCETECSCVIVIGITADAFVVEVKGTSIEDCGVQVSLKNAPFCEGVLN